jgi:hypothetical protein
MKLTTKLCPGEAVIPGEMPLTPRKHADSSTRAPGLHGKVQHCPPFRRFLTVAARNAFILDAAAATPETTWCCVPAKK